LVIHARQLALNVLCRLRQLLLDPRDVEKHAAVRTSAPGFHLAHDAAGHVIAREELGRTPRVLVALRVAPAFFSICRRLWFVVVRDVVEHEAAALAVFQHAALTAHTFSHEDALDARRPHHPGRMELDEFHVDQFRAGAIRERVAVAGPFPTVARDLVRATDAACGHDHRLGGEDVEAAAFAIVGKHARRAAAVHQQRDHGVLHVNSHTEVNRVIL
jgi:hypothetical protein